MLTAVLLMTSYTAVFAQKLTWRDASRNTSKAFLTSSEAVGVADSLVLYQLATGGWQKNQDWAAGIDHAAYEHAFATDIGGTIDNGATYTEMRYLARIVAANPNLSKAVWKVYRQVFINGLEFLLKMQYPNGGFPQFWPYEGAAHYAHHVTFNDDATVNVLRLLHDVSQQRPPYDALQLSDSLCTAAYEAFWHGLDCLLKCQIRKDGKLTVWCQQHDEVTLMPTSARSYELPSFGGNGESVNVLLFLMELDLQSFPLCLERDRICAAVDAGVEWLWNHRIAGMKLERFTNDDGQPDQRVVSGSPEDALLARYYDLTTEQPFFCDRDGIPHPHLSDIGYERRNGYAWIRPFPMQLMKKYKEWRELHP